MCGLVKNNQIEYWALILLKELEKTRMAVHNLIYIPKNNLKMNK